MERANPVDVHDASALHVLDALSAIRRRPAMYVGSLDEPSLPVRLLLQTLCPAVDAALEGECRRIEVSVNGASAVVSFDAGLPLSAEPNGEIVAKLLLTVLCACRNRKKHLVVGDELCDPGLAVSTALAEELRVETTWRGKATTYLFAHGREVGAAAIVDTAETDRTVMTFRLDPTILGENVTFDARRLEAELAKLRARVPGTEVVLAG